MPVLENASAVLASHVEITRTIPSPRMRVYRAWTDAAILQRWFGPGNMHCTSASLDARPGGAYQIAVRPDGSPESVPDAVASGTYTRVIAGEMLQFTWKPSWRQDEESLVTVEFADAAGEGTEITIRHEGFALDALDGYTSGWTACLDKLEAAQGLTADYERRLRIAAPAAHVMAGLISPEGVRRWWSTTAAGSGEEGGDLSLGFEGQEEPYVFHVDEATRTSVHWTSRLNSKLPDWEGTNLRFDLAESGPDACELHFRHAGLTPQLACYDMCESGWNRFLPSLVAYAESGKGTPYRKPAPAV